MRDYTKIEAWKLADDLVVAIYERTRAFPREELIGQTTSTFACLHGLIKAVEKKSGKIAKVVAAVTSALLLYLCFRSPWANSP